MKSEDIGALMRGVAAVIKEHVGSLASAVAARQAEIEKRIDALPPVLKGDPGDPGVAGERGEDGKSVTLDEIAPLLRDEISMWVAEIPRPQDGKSVTIDDVRPLIEQAVTDTMLVVKAAAVDDLKPLIAQDLQGFAAALSAKFASAEHAG